MQNQNLKKLLFILFVFVSLQSSGQELPFWEDIKEFKHQDSLKFPPKNAILFIGSSSFGIWKNLQQDFPQYTIINRAFGGSSLPHLIHYAEDVVFPYHPKQIIVYAGDNDLAASDTVTAQMVADRFVTLFKLIRKKMRKVNIAFVSIKPSPSREHLIPKVAAANAMIKEFLTKERYASYVDVYAEMLDSNGKPRKELFLEDMLHMNRDGYLIWIKTIQPFLLK